MRDELGFAGEDADEVDEALPAELPRDRATRSATRPAPTSRTGRRWSELLRPERIGVELTEELQLHPEQSTDALVVHHPEAKYFNAR